MLERPVDQEGEQREDVTCILSRNMGFCNVKMNNSSLGEGVIRIKIFISVFQEVSESGDPKEIVLRGTTTNLSKKGHHLDVRGQQISSAAVFSLFRYTISKTTSEQERRKW